MGLLYTPPHQDKNKALGGLPCGSDKAFNLERKNQSTCKVLPVTFIPSPGKRTSQIGVVGVK